eukprot:3975648-Amphidinium_carterae.1
MPNHNQTSLRSHMSKVPELLKGCTELKAWPQPISPWKAQIMPSTHRGISPFATSAQLHHT